MGMEEQSVDKFRAIYLMLYEFREHPTMPLVPQMLFNLGHQKMSALA